MSQRSATPMHQALEACLHMCTRCRRGDSRLVAVCTGCGRVQRDHFFFNRFNTMLEPALSRDDSPTRTHEAPHEEIATWTALPASCWPSRTLRRREAPHARRPGLLARGTSTVTGIAYTTTSRVREAAERRSCVRTARAR